MQTAKQDISTNVWRGYGGGVINTSDVKFERCLDQVALWLDDWSHEQRCALMEALLNETGHAHMQFIWTVIQPAMHRDLMYTAGKVFPEHNFQPISTYYSRKIKRRFQRLRRINYHRISSAYLQQYADVAALTLAPPTNMCGLNGDVSKSKDPQSNTMKQRVSCSRMPAMPALPCGQLTNHHRQQNSFQSALFDGTRKSLSWFSTAPPCIKFIEMPVRRHIQEEGNCRHGPTSSRDSHHDNNANVFQATETRIRLKTKDRSGDNGDRLINWYAHEWNDLQRNEFLHKLLLKLDPRQHYFIYSLLSIRQHRDFLSLLPEKISLKILNYLSPSEILTASKVSKAWQRLCANDTLWNNKCIQVHLDASPFDYRVTWKKAFRKSVMATANWKIGKYSVIDCNGHKDKVLSLTFFGARMATGSLDKTIRIWDLADGTCSQVLRGHTKGVWCLQFFTPTLLVSGAYDHTIKVWNLRGNGSCARTLLGHKGPVWAIANRGSTLVSGSQDKTARIWEISRCQLLHTLKGHFEAVFAVDLDEAGRLVITGSADKTVRIWRVRSGTQMRVIWTNPPAAVMAVGFSQGYMACAHGYSISFYKLCKTNAICLRTYREHVHRIEAIQLQVSARAVGDEMPTGVLVSGGKDSVLKYRQLDNDQSERTLRGHDAQINCVKCDSTRIATASYDNQVKIWDFSILA